MKLFNQTVYRLSGFVLLLLLTACQKDTDFGNDRTVSGVMVDQAGNSVAGDITTADFIVKALGEGDVVTTDMRVKGDGSFLNNKMYRKKYKIWVNGPVTISEDTLRVDLSVDNTVVHNFHVSPFIAITKPVLNGTPVDSIITINYSMTAQTGLSISKKELYCATYPFPNAIIGSGTSYSTVKVTLAANTGTVKITGLSRKTKYFIRIGAVATGSTGYNYSEQIEVSTL